MAASPSVTDESPVVQPRHVRVLGYLRGPRPDGMDCDRPLHVQVSDAHGEHFEVWRCSNHRQSKCGPCATRYRRRVESVAAEGLWKREGFYYLLTLTAPGAREHRMPSGKVCPCTPAGGVDLARWNAGAGRLWNRMLTAIERQYLVRPTYFRAAEVQDRGAIHHHVLLWSPRKLAERTLRKLAMLAGYGHEVDLQRLTPGSRKAAFYVSKYVAKSADSRDEVPWWGSWADQETGELLEGHTVATFRTWSQSRKWGTSMAAIRDVARVKYLERVQVLIGQADGLVSGLAGESPPAPS